MKLPAQETQQGKGRDDPSKVMRFVRCVDDRVAFIGIMGAETNRP
jgi:hypothetical protein